VTFAGTAVRRSLQQATVSSSSTVPVTTTGSPGAYVVADACGVVSSGLSSNSRDAVPVSGEATAALTMIVPGSHVPVGITSNWATPLASVVTACVSTTVPSPSTKSTLTVLPAAAGLSVTRPKPQSERARTRLS
jgi:hypothetical protein